MLIRLWIAVLIVVSATAVAQDKQAVDLIVSGGTVVTMDCARGPLFRMAVVAVRGDSILRSGLARKLRPAIALHR